MRPFWDYIEDAFRKANISLAELARRTEISQPVLCKYRQRQVIPSLEYAHRICCALGVSLVIGADRQRKDEQDRRHGDRPAHRQEDEE